MPTYDLACRACGHRFEKYLGRVLRTEDQVCPECGSTDVERGIGGGFLGAGTKAPVRTASSDCAGRRFG